MTEKAASATVNGRQCRLPEDGRPSLGTWLREDLGLTGTKIGCGHGHCGSCSVLVDGHLHLACLLPATLCEGRTITTVEGLDREARPLQAALVAAGGLQCGFCTPGMVVAGYAALRGECAQLQSRTAIRAALAGNICRCTGYQPIVDAIQLVAQAQLDCGESSQEGP